MGSRTVSKLMGREFWDPGQLRRGPGSSNESQEVWGKYIEVEPGPLEGMRRA